MSFDDRPGLLLLNLGTPDSTKISDVRRYLKEFLWDERVLDVAAWKRWLVLNLFILPFRPKESGEAYESIWTERGSPLMNHTVDLTDKVRERFGHDVVVDFAMRYGNPSVPSVLKKFADQGVNRLVVFPLYPQYSSAATGTAIQSVVEAAGREWNTPYLQFVPPFYEHPAFIDSCVQVAKDQLAQADPEVVFFSFHGLPERHLRKSDVTDGHCLEVEDCCAKAREAGAMSYCYRAQCVATANAMASELGIPEEKLEICFQSRLGRDPWIKPYTDIVMAEKAKEGLKRAAILSPAFVADCLETLEELGIRGLEIWQENGGESLEVIPCINATDRWADAVVQIVRESSAWLHPQAASTSSELRSA